MAQNWTGHVNEWGGSLGPVVEDSGSSRNRSTLDAPAPLKGPLLFQQLVAMQECWARVTSSSNFIKSKFSWETSSFLNIKNWFKNSLNPSAAGFSPQLPSCNPFHSRNLNYFHHGRCVRTKPPDFPTCRPVQETKSIEYNDHLPLPNKTAHTQFRRGYLILCPQGWASQNIVSRDGVLTYIFAAIYPAAPDLLSFKCFLLIQYELVGRWWELMCNSQRSTSVSPQLMVWWGQYLTIKND